MNLHQIRERLDKCNPTVFQELSESLLALRNKNYKAFSRSGGHKTKQKTTTGTPDSYFLLKNGKYLFVEVTTCEHKGNELLNKLKSDINSCLNENKTKVPVDKISEIILCYNSKLKPEELEKVNARAIEQMGTPPTHFSIDLIAHLIFFHHRNLAQEYLNLSLDSGQIISIQRFIEEHDNQKLKLATPIDTVFHARTIELNRLTELIQSEDIILISGPAGVGKTRISIEAIEQFLAKNLEFNAHAVSSKGVSFFNLDDYFGDGSENILLVDDVNRVDKFDQIVKWSKGIPKGKFKLIFTVRDYALKDICDTLIEYKIGLIKLSGLNDDAINAIIGQPPFSVIDWEERTKINAIAKGNPRFAIMCARILRENQSIDSLNNVSELFEYYFQTFVTDNDALKNKSVLQVLGILSFFFALPYDEDSVLNRISSTFKIPLDLIKEGFDALHELDLVEMKYKYVKISDQNLATYFFYRTFIKKTILSFDGLWTEFYSDYEHRFRDSIYSIEKTFDSGLVVNYIKPTLLQHWEQISNDNDRAIRFLNFSWLFLPQEALDYVDRVTQAIQSEGTLELSTSYGTNDFVGAKNEEQHLHLLAEFFKPSTRLKEAIYLSIELVKKKPQCLPQLAYHLDHIVYYSSDDSRNLFLRQRVLLEFLVNELETSGRITALLFIHLSRKYLEYLRWKYNEGQDNQKDDQRIQSFKQMRSITLETLFKLYTNYQDEVFDVLLDSYTGINKNNKYTLAHDLKVLIPWIEQELETARFDHCYFVQEVIRLAQCELVQDIQFDELKNQFEHRIYSTFSVINWDRRRGRNEYDFENFDEFLELKNRDISERFTFHSTVELAEFINDYQEILDWNKIELHSNYLTIDAIIKSNFNNNEEIGYQTFLELIKLTDSTNNAGDVTIGRDSMNFFSSLEHLHERLWNDLDGMLVDRWWKFRVLMLIPAESIDEIHSNRLFQWVKNYNVDYYFHYDWVIQYEQCVSNFRIDLLKIILERNANEDIRISISNDFFKKPQIREDDLVVLKRTYIQQYEIQHVKQRLLDLNGEVMLLLLTHDRSFLLEFVRHVYSKPELQPRTHELKFNRLWKLTDFELYLREVFLFVSEMEQTQLYDQEHFINSFFEHQPEFADRVDRFLIQLIVEHSSNVKLMKLTFRVIHNYRKSLFEEAFIEFLRLNRNVDDFKKIKWTRNQTIFSGGDIVGDIRAMEWQSLIDIIEYHDLLVRCRSIISFLRSKVEREKSYGDLERERSFLGKYY